MPRGMRLCFSERWGGEVRAVCSARKETMVNPKSFGLMLVSSACLWQLGLATDAAAQLPQRPPDTMAERVRACVPCHGQNGRGTSDVYFPRLAGKPAGYLYNQLVAFRDGRRKYAPMNYLLGYLPDEYLRKMAEYYADAQEPFEDPSPATVSEEVLRRGRMLVTQGDHEKQMPACVACHGPNLSGGEPGIPGLVGLRADYITAQLGAWSYGTRTAAEPDCMQLVAARMTEADITAVAAWLAAMPIPADTKPLKRSSERLPLPCGSQKQ
jgi:cytochrome c553